MSEVRNLPNSLEAERAVLGCLMLDGRRVDEVAEVLVADDFYRASHGRLYRLLLEMAGRGEPIELVAVIERVGAKHEDYGGLSYISGLSDEVPSAENVLYYAGEVRDRAVRRRLIASCQAVENQAHAGGELDELLETAEARVHAVTRTEVKRRDWEVVGDIGRGLVEAMVERRKSPTDATGLPTGYQPLDRLLNGFRKQQLIVLAARPRLGKSSLMLNIAENMAMTWQRVGIFSLEMSKEQLLTRLYASVGGIPLGHMLSGNLSHAEWARLFRAQQLVDNLPMHIDDTPGLTMREIRRRAQRLKRGHPDLAMLAVDYLQKVAPGSSGMGVEQAVSENAQGAKNLSKELDIPVLALAQLNRQSEGRPDKRPVMMDLRSSGSIEQEADVILFIYRDDVFNKASQERGVAEVICGKQREGEEGTVKLWWLGEYARFETPAF